MQSGEAGARRCLDQGHVYCDFTGASDPRSGCVNSDAFDEAEWGEEGELVDGNLLCYSMEEAVPCVRTQ